MRSSVTCIVPGIESDRTLPDKAHFDGLRARSREIFRNRKESKILSTTGYLRVCLEQVIPFSALYPHSMQNFAVRYLLLQCGVPAAYC
jgi:hypothetical protein